MGSCTGEPYGRPDDRGQSAAPQNVGLPCEDEFAVICGWLGRCRLLCKLDPQQILTASRKLNRLRQISRSRSLFSLRTKALPNASHGKIHLRKQQLVTKSPWYYLLTRRAWMLYICTEIHLQLSAQMVTDRRFVGDGERGDV